MIKKLVLAFGLLTGALSAQQQTVSGTVLNVDGTPLAGGVLTAQLTNASGVSYDKLPYNSQTALIPKQQVAVVLDSNGSFSLGVFSNTPVTGSTWSFTICSPSANTQCATVVQAITAATDLSSALSSAIATAVNPSARVTQAYLNQTLSTYAGESVIQRTVLAQQIPAFRKAVAVTRNSGASTRVLLIGDSTTAGCDGSPTCTPGGGAYLNSWGQKLVSLSNSTVTPTVRGLVTAPSVCGAQSDSRWVAGTGWTNISGYGAGGCGAWQGNGAPTGNLVLTTGLNADTYKIYYLSHAGLPSITATATGGAPVSCDDNGTQTILTCTAVAASASVSNTVTFTVNGSSGYVLGVEPSLSTAKQIIISNAGMDGAQTGNWVNINNVGQNGVAFIQAFNPTLAIISLGINDATNQVPAATYQANMVTLITTLQALGSDIILMDWPPSSGTTPHLMEGQYLTVLQNLASQYGLPLIDIYGRFGASYNATFMNDGLHPNAYGYWDWAVLVNSTLFQ